VTGERDQAACLKDAFVPNLAAVEAFFGDFQQQFKDQCVKSEGCFTFVFKSAEEPDVLGCGDEFDAAQGVEGGQREKMYETVVEGGGLDGGVFQIRGDQHDGFGRKGVNFASDMNLAAGSFVPIAVEKGIAAFCGHVPLPDVEVDVVADQLDFRVGRPSGLGDLFSETGHSDNSHGKS